VSPSASAERTDFAAAVDLEVLRYSQVWEDHAVLEGALDVGPGDDVLSIAAAGDNTLALLLREPRSVVAIDVSTAQLALLELKLAAITVLEHEEFVALLGVREHPDRLALYARVRDSLGERARRFWDSRGDDIAAGVVDRGMLDTYFARVRTDLIQPLLSADAPSRLLELDDPARQREHFDRAIALPEFERGFRSAASRSSLSGSARDESQFRYVEEKDMGAFFWDRFRHVCTEVPARGNLYLEWFLTGRYADLESGPPYLRPESYQRLRELVPRVRVVQSDLIEHLTDADPGAYSKANLSDMLEYLSEDAAGELFDLLASRLRPGGRIAYWNLLVPRRSPERLRDVLTPLDERADELWRGDRCFFYGGFRLEGVEDVAAR
jgi:S-adenosylmethionine-diacylglycerol 3-amino-3-carboxypropyl transferase